MQHITRFTPDAPHRFDLTLQVVARFTHPVVDLVGSDGAYWRALYSQNGAMSLWRVTTDLDVSLAAECGSVDYEKALYDLAHILAVDEDSRPFYDFARQDATLWRIVQPLQGIRWLRTPTVFEALIAVIIEQHIAWVAAQKAQRALIEWGGNAIHYEGRAYYAFPTVDQLAAATPEDLAAMKITTRRKQWLIDLARRVRERTFDLEGLRRLSPQEAYRVLVAQPGVGHWTAANVVMRALGGYPYVPDADVALQAAANRYFNGVEGKLTAAQTRSLFSRYGEFAGSAAYYTMMRLVIDRYQVQR